MNKATKECPYCGEEILSIAKKCKYCGEWLNQEDKSPINGETKKITCSICGEEIPNDVDICPYCNEKIINNPPVEIQDDPFFHIKLQPTWALIIISIFCSFPVTQLLWLIYGNIWNSRKELHGFRMYRIILTDNDEFSEKSLFMLLAFSIVLVTLYVINSIDNSFSNDFMNFLGILILIVCIISGTISLKYASVIEKHIQNYHNVNVNSNKFLTFFLQAFYLNFFLLTYKVRIDKAKKYQRS